MLFLRAGPAGSRILEANPQSKDNTFVDRLGFYPDSSQSAFSLPLRPTFLYYSFLVFASFLLLPVYGATLSTTLFVRLFLFSDDGLLAALVCSKADMMEYGRQQQKEPRSPWLAIKFGCCASKDDIVQERRDVTRAAGKFEPLSCYSSSYSVHSYLHGVFSSVLFPLSLPSGYMVALRSRSSLYRLLRCMQFAHSSIWTKQLGIPPTHSDPLPMFCKTNNTNRPNTMLTESSNREKGDAHLLRTAACRAPA